ncbi:uncharacterized protein Z518_11015 [Rhinocladiella mackenziei CBS 650.93]|uniref:Uncharacterized protein n=1 Tax=Rhinocladiella mackenziei CBS 650.93 TaxID=1442369 RepID=A0A0D2GML9_9EURO|nr:uncharacterized protein Z518_11015 [Rhinocladiella mackenziei CBS 650.93]KIW99602.1 hypothetical protein Z518_11015 [Rhinocladiella mackenziei CBS 650.93]
MVAFHTNTGAARDALEIWLGLGLYPRLIRFLYDSDGSGNGIHHYEVKKWLERHNLIDHDLKFASVAYNSTQFADTAEDIKTLHPINREAARDANALPAG